jgi:transcriptional regulator with PAS, ATPase and Fis domain
MEKLNECLCESYSRPVKGIKINRVDEDKTLEDICIGYDFIYKSHGMKALAKEIIKASKYNCTVLIEGETGVGKEKVAKLIHNLSERKMQPLITVNCASIPENLMEAEFFGYDAGAFTGASSRGKIGYFEQANKGMLFLDEVSELPFELQSKLLRALQDKMFYRVGGEKPIQVDVRVIAATNANIKNKMKSGDFRDDLYYRLAVLTMQIPPLRKRKVDIVPLAEHFVNEYNNKFGLNKRIDDEGFQCLLEYEWPGNIRELENVIQRLLIYTDTDVIDKISTFNELYRTHHRYEDGLEFGDVVYPDRKKSFRLQIEQLEKELIINALQKCGTTRKAAESLGISQAQFMRKKTKHSV